MILGLPVLPATSYELIGTLIGFCIGFIVIQAGKKLYDIIKRKTK